MVQNGYLTGMHAPGQSDPDAAYVVAHHLAARRTGSRCRRCGRTCRRQTRIGPALNLHPTYPADDSEARSEPAILYDGYENRLYLDPIFRASYPADVLADLGPDAPMANVILDGDLEIISLAGRPARRAVLLPDLRRRRRQHGQRCPDRRRRSGSRSTPRACTTS